MDAILHLGTEKTGTSSIQRFLHHNRQALIDQGFYFMKSTGVMDDRKLSAYCLLEDQFDDFHRNKFIDTIEKKQIFEQQLEREIEGELQGLPNSVHTVLFSSKYFHSRVRTSEQRQKLKTLLARYFDNLKLLNYIRPQVEVAISYYSTYLKTEGIADLEEYLTRCHADNYYYDYDQYLSGWSDDFPKSALTVRLFDRKQLVNGDVIADFCHFNGLDIALLEKTSEENESVRPTGQEILKLINRHLPTFINNVGMNPAHGTLVRIINGLYAGPGQKPSPEQALAIQIQFNDINERVRQRWFPERAVLFDIDYAKFDKSEPIDYPIVEFFEAFIKEYARLNLSDLSGIPAFMVDQLRDIALLLETKDIQSAYKLMKLALLLRPNGPLIQQKVQSYAQKITNKGVRYEGDVFSVHGYPLFVLKNGQISQVIGTENLVSVSGNKLLIKDLLSDTATVTSQGIVESINHGPLKGCRLLWHNNERFSLLGKDGFYSASPNHPRLIGKKDLKEWEKFKISGTGRLKEIQELIKNSILITSGKGKWPDYLTPSFDDEAHREFGKTIWVIFYALPGSIPKLVLPFDLSAANYNFVRLKQVLGYLDYLICHEILGNNFWYQINARFLQFGAKYLVGIQFYDKGQNIEHSACFDKSLSDNLPYTIPDIHFFNTRAYFDYRKELIINKIAWDNKKDLAFWRGSTTGKSRLSVTNISQLKRFRLCDISRRHPKLLDAKITNVAQAASDMDKKSLKDYLTELGIYAEKVSQVDFAKYKYQIDIDGNVTAWGLIQKLMMGSCVIKIESDRRQWFYHRLQPWEHYVPVKNDMSDLVEQIEWCINNDHEAREIALRGKALADSMSFRSEMEFAAQQILKAAKVF